MRKVMQGSPRVFWTAEEQNKIFEIVLASRCREPETPLVKLIEKAQAQLPEDRRRFINTIAAVPWLVERLKERLLQLYDHHTDLELKAMLAEDDRKQPTPVQVQPTQPVVQTPSPQPAKATLDDFTTDDILQTALGRLLKIVQPIMSKPAPAPSQPMQTAPSQDSLPSNVLRQPIVVPTIKPTANGHSPEAPTIKKLKFTIVGLIPIQEREIEQVYGKTCKFTFIPASRASR
jgi:hypothetical protein